MILVQLICPTTQHRIKYVFDRGKILIGLRLIEKILSFFSNLFYVFIIGHA